MFKIRGKISKRSYVSAALASFILIFAIWMILSKFELVNSVFLPSPMKVILSIADGISNGDLLTDIYISCRRIFIGVMLAVIVGIPLGILCGTFQFAEATIRPISEFIRYMPVPAFIPLIMVWIGIDESAKIALLFLGVFFQIILMTADDVLSVSDDLLNAGYTLGVNNMQAIKKILLPAMAPRMLDTFRMVIGWAWTYVTVAEMVAANEGIGYTILKAQRFLNTERIFAGILMIGFIGLVTDRGLFYLGKVLFHWKEENS